MTFHGFLKTDLVNYPSKVAATVFTQGCNFRCPYCHNPQFVECQSDEEYADSEILEYLTARSSFIDGLVISGGEPTLHKELKDFIIRVKALGLCIKLDTNGSNPQVLKQLLDRNLLDYVAMDLKAPFSKYPLMGFSDTDRIIESMEILRESDIPYEFRTTCPRELLTPEDLHEMGRMLRKDEVWKLNPFNPKITLDENYRKYTTYSEEELREIFKNTLAATARK